MAHSIASRTVMILLALCATVSLASQAELLLYVSPIGNDDWSGRLPEPAPDGTDGPLASFQGARDALRVLRASEGVSEPARVLFRGGDYFVAEPVVFTPQDSGTGQAPVAFAAFQGEIPVIHGGRRIEGWRQNGPFWVADVPEAAAGNWRFGAFWTDGHRRTPARTPNARDGVGDFAGDDEVFFTEKPVVETGVDGKEQRSATRFHFRDNDLKAWDSLKDAVFVVYHSWETALLRPKEIDEISRIIEFTGPTNWGFGYWRPDQRYFVEHLFEGLDQPGEWYLNREQGRLYYIPVPGEDMSKAEAVAPVTTQLLRLDGDPANGEFVAHLRFEGLRFHYTDYPIAETGHSDGQAAFSVEAAVQATGARDCRFVQCEIGHAGGYGVWFRTGSQRNVLQQCEVFDLGAGGVRIGEGHDAKSEQEATGHNTIDNCFIHDGGRIFRGAVGVWIGRSSHNTLSHCEICDFRYTGISVGWSWGYAESTAHHNTIEFNHVHHIALQQLSDTGAIYTLGVSPGTVIRNNIFHDVMSYPGVSGGWGIYFDEGSTEILAENNLVYNTWSGNLHQHYGRENTVRNNILAFSHNAQLVRSREEEHVSFILERNIVLFNNGRLLGSTWKNGNWRADNNCYWDATGEDADFAGRSFAEWQQQGFDAGGIVADPLFVNAEAADFMLRPESPALSLGFQPIDTSKVGLYGPAEWTQKPLAIARAPFSPPPLPEPVTFLDGFEDTPAGDKARGASTLGEEGGASILVTAETAASGSQSLQFVDAAGLQYGFFPYLVYAPHIHSGVAKGSFAIRLEPGATMYHEWRDDRNPYRVGPSIWFHGDGRIVANGRELLQAPLSHWLRIDIACPLGKQRSGMYTLVVTLSDGTTQRLDDLPCGSTEFGALDWFGFVSNATQETVAYIDDVSLAAE